MIASDYDHSILSGWPGRAETPEAIGEKFLATLDDFRTIDPALADWVVAYYPTLVRLRLEDVRAIIADLVEVNVRKNWDPDDEEKLVPFPAFGYSMLASSRAAQSPKSLTLNLNAGATIDSMNEALVEGMFPGAVDASLVTYPTYKALLLTIVKYWRPTWACAFAYVLEPMRHRPIPPNSRFSAPWLAYVSAEVAAGFEPPNGIVSERAPDGGLLLIATEERLDPTRPDHASRMGIISDFMLEHIGERKEIEFP